MLTADRFHPSFQHGNFEERTMSGFTRLGEAALSSPGVAQVASEVSQAAIRLGADVPFIGRALTKGADEVSHAEPGALAAGLRSLVNEADQLLQKGGVAGNVRLTKDGDGVFNASLVGGRFIGTEARWTAESPFINVKLPTGRTHALDKVAIGNVTPGALDPKLAFVGPHRSPIGRVHQFGAEEPRLVSTAGNGAEIKAAEPLREAAPKVNADAAPKVNADAAPKVNAAAAHVAEDEFVVTPKLTQTIREIASDARFIAENGGSRGFVRVTAQDGAFNLRFADGPYAGLTGQWTAGAEKMRVELPTGRVLQVPLQGHPGVAAFDPKRSFVDGGMRVQT
jgi:hypothetical protein